MKCGRDNGQLCPLRNEGAFNLIALLKLCAKEKDLEKGCKLHAYIREHRLIEKHGIIASTLVSMYARCGALAQAQQVLEELPVRGVHVWTAVISGYVQLGYHKEALNCFENMQHEGQSPDAITLIGALKACGGMRAAVKGEQIHEKFVSLGLLEKSIMLGSNLVDMYAKCGELAKAQQVLYELPIHNVVMWTALMAGYVQQAEGMKALKCFENMQHEGQCPDVVTFICALKACGSIKALDKGKQIHGMIVSSNFLEKDIILGSTLVDMYARCGALAKAQRVLEELPARNVVTWSALIAGYAEQGQGKEALKCFEAMENEGHSLNVGSVVCALKACGSIGSAAIGEKIHEKIVKLGLLKDLVLGGALIDMYAKCGALAKAQDVLYKLPVRNVVTWNALLAGYTQHGQSKEALKCFDSMQHDGHSPNVVTFMCALKACGITGSVGKGENIHETINALGLLQKNVVLGNTLVNMYVKCGALSKAQQVLCELPVQDVATWNTLIAGYTLQGQGQEALKCFDSMQREGHSPNTVTFVCALKACGSLGAVVKGARIHEKILSLGMLEESNVLRTALVDVYARCGLLEKAQKVLYELAVQDVTAWNALIGAYVEQGYPEEALKCFESMQHEGHTPDMVSFTCALKACGIIGAIADGEKIHDKIIGLGTMEKDVVLGSTLVDMYSRCGEMAKAKQVLDELPSRNAITWTAMIAGYTRHGQGEEALKCFESMQNEGHGPDVVSFVCALKACGILGAVTKGKQICSKIVKLGLFGANLVLGSSMVDMYAKCGALAKALEVLEKLPVQDVVTWTALLTGYAQQGQTEEVFNCVEKMHYKGVMPDVTTLVCILNVCSHSGLLHQAEMLFWRIIIKLGISPDVEHYCCMVDAFGRAGRLLRALVVIESMPFVGYLPVWLALLGACCTWGDVRVGRLAFDCALCADKSDATFYICMANMYAAAGMPGDVHKIDLMRAANKNLKK